MFAEGTETKIEGYSGFGPTDFEALGDTFEVVDMAAGDLDAGTGLKAFNEAYIAIIGTYVYL